MTAASDLRLGNKVVMTKIPESVWRTAPSLRDGPDGILRVYQRAVDRQNRLLVSSIDEFGRPWVKYDFRNKHRQIEYHSMLVDDDSYELIPG